MLCSVAAVLVIAAAPDNPWLSEAKELVGELRFSEALTRLEVARKVPGLERGVLREALELQAYCEVAEGRRDAAEQTYTTLLELEPSAELSRAVSSPKVLEVFEAVKRRLYPSDYVRLEERVAPVGLARFVVVDPWWQVQAVVLLERRDGGAWRELPLKEQGGEYTAVLRVVGGERLEWLVEVRGATETLAHLGTREQPRALKTERIEPSGVAVSDAPSGRRVTGVVALGLGGAALAVATGLAVSGWNLRVAARDPSRPPGDFADTARAAERDGQQQQAWSTGLFIGGGVAAVTGVVLAW